LVGSSFPNTTLPPTGRTVRNGTNVSFACPIVTGVAGTGTAGGSPFSGRTTTTAPSAPRPLASVTRTASPAASWLRTVCQPNVP
jgi:hypothetical protein